MKHGTMTKRLTAALLALLMLLPLSLFGQSARAQETDEPSETLKGIYDALLAPDSDYSINKALYLDFYPELEYSETLEADRINLSRKANGNEYFTDSSTNFVLDGDYLTAVIADDDFVGIARVQEMANAVASYLGMETDLVSGYLNGLSDPAIETENFSMSEDEAAGLFTFRLYIGGPWDMKELDQMVLTEAILGDEPLGEEYTSQGGNVGKLLYMASGNGDGYTALIAEYGGLDELAYRSIVNLVTLRKPIGYEGFLKDFTELKALETDDYTVVLDPDEETIAGIMGQRNEKYSYVLLRFGAEQGEETEVEIYVPTAEILLDSYFRPVIAIPQGTAGASLAQAQCACDALAFAAGNQLWMTDTEMLQANLLEAWNSLTGEEQNCFYLNYLGLDELLKGCFEDWGALRGGFEDAGAADAMEALLEDGTSQWSWDTLSGFTRKLGSGED